MGDFIERVPVHNLVRALIELLLLNENTHQLIDQSAKYIRFCKFWAPSILTWHYLCYCSDECLSCKETRSYFVSVLMDAEFEYQRYIGTIFILYLLRKCFLRLYGTFQILRGNCDILNTNWSIQSVQSRNMLSVAVLGVLRPVYINCKKFYTGLKISKQVSATCVNTPEVGEKN